MSIQLNNVSYTYMARTPFEKQAIKNINLEIKKGEFVAIIGHTGSGKSTLVQHLNGLLKPTNGSITIDEIVLGKKDEKSKLARKKVGMVFQYPEHQLFEETIYADIAFGPKNLGLGKKEIDKRVRRAMNFVNLDYDMYKERSPFQLSGGQMRRVAIAGVVALQPDYLVLDEPAAGLDPCGRDAIFNKIVELHKKTGIAVVLVSHNMDDVAKMASRLIVMKSGEVAADGKPADVFKETETLVNTGLDIPQIISLMRALEKRGLPVNTDVLTINQAVDTILSALRGKNHAK